MGLLIAGSNGAGKSTLASDLLGQVFPEIPFLNFDLIAADSARAPSFRRDRSAARLVLETFDRHVSARQGFALETTLSGRTYLRKLRDAGRQGWKFGLIYIGLSDPLTARSRVEARVRAGGHDVPQRDIVRRWTRSLDNLTLYAELTDRLIVLSNQNATRGPVPIAEGNRNRIRIHAPLELPVLTRRLLALANLAELGRLEVELKNRINAARATPESPADTASANPRQSIQICTRLLAGIATERTRRKDG